MLDKKALLFCAASVVVAGLLGVVIATSGSGQHSAGKTVVTGLLVAAVAAVISIAMGVLGTRRRGRP
jgi:hypothetical protein